MKSLYGQCPLLGMAAVLLLLPCMGRGEMLSGDPEPGADTSMFDSPSNDEKPWTVSLLYGYETFRGVADGAWQNNGLNTGFNFGTRLGQFSDATGIGFQIGGTIGVYDWVGTDYRIRNNDQAETQGFLTMGLFRKSSDECPWSAAVVFDWMLNDNFSVFAATPTLNQWRYCLGYDLSETNAIGVWGTLHGQSSTREVNYFGPVTWQGVNLLSAFAHHKWEFGADTTVWVGAPQGDRLAGGGSLGEFLAGAYGNLPLSSRMGLYTLVTYMRPSAHPGPAAAADDEWSFAVGLAIYPRGDSHTETVANKGWAAMLPVASNGTFFVDASQNY